MSGLSLEFLAVMRMEDKLLQKTNSLSPCYNVDINNYTLCSNYEELDVDFKNSLLPLLQDISSNSAVYDMCAHMKGHYKEKENKMLIQIIIHVVPYNTALLAGIVQLNSTLLKTLFEINNSDINHYTWQVVPLKFIPMSYIIVISNKEKVTTDKLLDYFLEQIINLNERMLESIEEQMPTVKKQEKKTKKKEKKTKKKGKK